MPDLQSDTSNSAFKKDAVAFLNLSIVDSNGTEYRLPKGIALRDANGTPLDRALLQQFKSDPDKVYTLTGTIKSAARSTEVLSIPF